MADVSFNSSDHKLTESDVPQSEEGLQKSSQAVKELASGQTARDWTPEPAAQLLRTAIIHFFSTCDEAFTKEKATLHEFGTNVDLAIAEFARVNESTGDELKRIQDSITNQEVRDQLGRGLLQAGTPAQTDGSDTSATEATEAPTGADATYSGPSHFGQSASGGPTITGQ